MFRVFVFAWLAAVAVCAEPLSAQGWEQPTTVRAADVLPPELLQGELHRIDPTVRADGFQYGYTVRSHFGDFEVWGQTLLVLRLEELAALQTLEEQGGAGDAIREGLGALGDRVVDVGGKIVDDPGKFVGGLFGAVKKRFGRVVDKAGKTAKSAKKVADGTADAKREVTADVQKSVGVEKAERRLHERLGTDPYTRNEALARGVREAAKSQALARVVFDPISVSDAEGMAFGNALQALYQAPPQKVRQRNRESLRATGASEAEVEAFLSHPSFSLTLQTLVVADLQRLGGVDDLGVVLREGQPVESYEEALFLVQSLGMLADHHVQVEPMVRLLYDAALVAGESRSGKALVFGAVDHLLWTQALSDDLARFARAQRGKPLALHVTGSLSPRAREQVDKLGYAIHDASGSVRP